MGTATATEVQSWLMNPGLKQAEVTVAMSASYATGGDTLDLSDIFPTAVSGMSLIGDDLGYVLRYSRAAAGAPATGKVTAYYADYDAVADGALIEVAAAVNLAAGGLTAVRFMAYGY